MSLTTENTENTEGKINLAFPTLSEPQKDHSERPCLHEVQVVASLEEAEALSARFRPSLRGQGNTLPDSGQGDDEPIRSLCHTHNNQPRPLDNSVFLSAELEGENTKDHSSDDAGKLTETCKAEGGAR